MNAATHLSAIFRITIVLATLAVSSPAGSHMASERYIPIGQSPGVSHKLTIIGPIRAINAARRTITLSAPSGTVSVKIAKRTRIWLDRSKSKQTNLTGGFVDLKLGRTVEVKFIDPGKRRTADWVKIEVAAAPAR